MIYRTRTKTTRGRLSAHWRSVGLCLLAAAVFSSCSNDDDITGEGGNEAVQLKAVIQAGAYPAATANPNTRTTNGGDSWAEGDEVFVYMTPAGRKVIPNDLISLSQYNVNPATGALVLAEGQPETFYPQNDLLVDFTAYHGKYAPLISINELLISLADQETAERQNGWDVLYAKTTNVAKSNRPVNLVFNHVLSKVTFNVTLGDGLDRFTGSDVQAVVLNEIPGAAILDLQEGTITIDNYAGCFALKAENPSGNAAATFTALVIPQPTGDSGREVYFDIADDRYVWAIPDGEKFEAGVHYTYHATVNMTGVSVSAPDITPWNTTDNPTGSGEAEHIEIVPESNSYMAKPNGPTLFIPVSQANRVLTAEGLGADVTGLDAVTADNYTVELVWADTPVGTGGVIEYIGAEQHNGKGYVRVKPGEIGNAVVGIKLDGETDYRWSWHIWVTDEVPYDTDIETGLTWMDRNLGAAGNYYVVTGQNGLFYQWGRKDAFPGSDGGSNNQIYYTPSAPGGTAANLPTGSYTELPDMVANPLAFATNYDTYRGSVNIAEDNDSWGGVSGTKTIYDPCPCGWKVPPIKANGRNSWGNNNATDWEDFLDNGRVFNGVDGTSDLWHFYHASGHRLTSNGQLYNQGTNGYYWSATSAWGTNGYYLLFGSSSVGPTGDYYHRAQGFSVRCVKE